MTAPSPPIMTSPAQGAVLPGPTVPVTMTVYDWGNGCNADGGSAWFVSFYYSIGCQGPLQGPYWHRYGVSTGLPFVPGQLYCVAGNSHNGGDYVGVGSTYTFRTASLPTFTSSGVKPNPSKCNGALISGRAGSPNTHNPITIEVDMAYDKNDFAAGKNFLREGRLVLLSAYSMGYGANSVDATLLESSSRPYVSARLSDLSNPLFDVSTIDSVAAPYWGSTVKSGNKTNSAGTATVMGIGVDTRVTVIDNKTLRLTYTLRFDDTFTTPYASTLLAIYFMGVGVDYADGHTVTTNPEGYSSGAGKYVHVGYWQADVVPPVADITLTPNADPFYSQYYYILNWGANDGSAPSGSGFGVKRAAGYCQSTTGQNIYMSDISYNTAYYAETTAQVYPAISRCYADVGTIGQHIIYTPIPFDYNNANYTWHVEDFACNVTTVTRNAIDPDPWMLTTGGNLSAWGGATGFTLRNSSLTNIVPGLGDDSYLSRYLALAGNTTLPAGRRSKNLFSATNYMDDSIKPGAAFGTDSWYTALSEVLAANTTVTDLAVNSIPTNFTNQLGAVSGGHKVVRITPAGGELAIGAAGVGGGVCNGNYVILVNGNLRIHPNLTSSGASRCVYVVSGNVTIDAGVYTPMSNANAGYDTVEGYFLVDGTFRTAKDQPVGQSVGNALQIIGGLASKLIDLKRELPGAQSSNQPSEVFKYDPGYILQYRGLLGINEFSIREF